MLRKILISCAVSLLICILSYLQDICPFPIFDSLDVFSKVEPFLGISEPFPEDVMLVSTSNDRMLVSTDAGNISISDRQKITRFLNVADSVQTYKMILYDLLLEEEIRSEYDSGLVEVLARIPRTVMVKTRSLRGTVSSIQDPVRLSEKCAFNDFNYTALRSGFKRYQIVQNGEASAALKMYRMTGAVEDTVYKCGPLFFSHSRLCVNTPLIPLNSSLCSFDAAGNALLTRCNIGRDYLDMDVSDLASEMNGKIIIIGDFDNDVHNTYLGKVSGSMIAYSVFRFLQNGNHIIWYYDFICLFLFYWLIAFVIMNQWTGKFVLKYVKSKFGTLCLSFIGWSLALSIVGIIEYSIHGIITNILLPSLVISLFILLLKTDVIHNENN